MKNYKVIQVKVKWATGGFDTGEIENEINTFAKEGWEMISCVKSTTNTELIIFLEREELNI